MPPASGVAGIQIWAKPLDDAHTAALFINGGGANYTASITLKELNVTIIAGTSVKVTDVWSGEDAGPVSNGMWNTGNVMPMDSRFVIFERISAEDVAHEMRMPTGWMDEDSAYV